jgi:hypothetical protein
MTVRSPPLWPSLSSLEHAGLCPILAPWSMWHNPPMHTTLLPLGPPPPVPSLTSFPSIDEVIDLDHLVGPESYLDHDPPATVRMLTTTPSRYPKFQVGNLGVMSRRKYTHNPRICPLFPCSHRIVVPPSDRSVLTYKMFGSHPSYPDQYEFKRP